MAQIHKVVGAIQATPMVTKSTQYRHAGARNVRSCGVYAIKTRYFNRETRTHHDAVRIDYWTSGYKHQQDRAQSDLEKVFATLAAKGIEVLTVVEPWMHSSDIMETNYYVLETN
jgi:hypothetical protein